jgi:proteasome assembly chaperone (PAC2) family protein
MGINIEELEKRARRLESILEEKLLQIEARIERFRNKN